MNYAVILAGGVGSRLKSSKIPKQFVELEGIPILQHVVDKFLFSIEINKIVVVVNDIWYEHAKNILSDSVYKNVSICTGGNTRQESLYNGVKFIEQTYGISSDDKIISHDAARPFITLRIIEENIQKLNQFKVVDTVIPATDTIVKSDNGIIISNIPDRSTMYQGQTPQSFYAQDFIKLYESLTKDYLDKVTDAARIFAENGFDVGLVNGSEYNIKITTDYDLMIAEFLTKNKK